MSFVQSLFLFVLLGSAPALDERESGPRGQSLTLPQVLTETLDPAPQAAFQMRIEQRIIIRVPRQSLLQSSLAPLPAPRRAEQPEAPRYERRTVGKCVAMRDVTGVRVIDDDMLVLFMRDRRMIEAELDRSCSAREFYQGFYMERSGDGQLCVDRDMIQARSGSKCEVERLRQLVPED